MNNYIERFNTGERVLHWFVTAAFFTLVLSGLGLYSRLFTGYFHLFGGGQNAILVHKIAGCLFFVSSLMLFLTHRKEVSTFDDDDREWIKGKGGYLTRDDAHFNNGKFNAGQKLFGLFIGGATVALGVTGIFMWAPMSFPRGLVQFSLFAHGLLFVCAVLFVLIHIYLATLGNPGTIEGMLYGDVRRKWARKHHPKWYREAAGEREE